MIYFEEQHRVCILYKSGNAVEFWVTKFSIKTGYGGAKTYEWTRAVPGVNAINLGADEIEAVWQMGTRKKLKFGIPPQEEK